MTIDSVLSELEGIIGHRFTDFALLETAVTHASFNCGNVGNGGRNDYERLEFLGDRVLSLVMADFLMSSFPDAREGDLAFRHVALVRRETLSEIAAKIGLGRFLKLSRGEDESGGRDNPAILCDSLEAVIAALFLDGGLKTAKKFIAAHWTEPMLAVTSPPKDDKTLLQEWTQGAGKGLPAYAVLGRKGPDHDPVFTVEVNVTDLDPAMGEGASKRSAEQAAAEALLERIGAMVETVVEVAVETDGKIDGG
jgi:ribonuclease-3